MSWSDVSPVLPSNTAWPPSSYSSPSSRSSSLFFYSPLSSIIPAYTHMGVSLPAGAGATLRDTLPKKMDSPFSQCYLLPKTPQVGADIKNLKSFQETELSRRSLLAHLIWSPFWQMSFWHIFTTVMSSIKSFWPEAAELGSVPWHFKKSNKSIFFTKLPNSRDFFFKTGTDGLNTEMGRTETLIRETRTIGLDNHLILHGQKQLELNGEGSIDVHHLSFQPWQP